MQANMQLHEENPCIWWPPCPRTLQSGPGQIFGPRVSTYNL